MGYEMWDGGCGMGDVRWGMWDMGFIGLLRKRDQFFIVNYQLSIYR
jgi:hypothetical protein